VKGSGDGRYRSRRRQVGGSTARGRRTGYVVDIVAAAVVVKSIPAQCGSFRESLRSWHLLR
jgi:hypothetical protein